MKKGLLFLLCSLAAGALAADGDFLKNLRPEESRSAGLEKLSAEELTRLEQLVQRFKSGEVVEVQAKAAAKVLAVEQAAEQKIAAAEARVVAPEKPAAPATRQPGWFTALITLHKAAEKPEKAEPLESRLIGRFTGWSGHTIFKLEDGTRWEQQNAKDRYDYYPAMQAPKVKIVPASLAGFWLRIDGVNMSVRVVPTDLAGADR